MPVVLLVFLLPFEAIGLDFTSITRVGVLAVLGTAALLAFHPKGIPFPRKRRGLFLYFVLLPVLIAVAVTLSGLHSTGPSSAGVRLKVIMSAATQPMVTLAVFWILWRSRRVDAVISAFIVIGVALSVANVAQALGIVPEIGRMGLARGVGQWTLPVPRSSPIEIFGTYNVLAFTALALSGARFEAARLEHGATQTRVVYMVAGVVIVAGIVITQSRSALLALVAVVALFAETGRHRVTRAVLLLAAVAVAVHYLSMVETVIVEVDPRGVVNRLTTFRIAWDAFKRSPLFGIGWNLTLLVNDNGSLVHNSFLALLGYLGLVGFAIHMSAYATSTYLAFRQYMKERSTEVRWLCFGIGASMVAWFIENMFYLGVREYTVWVLQGVLLTLLLRSGSAVVEPMSSSACDA